MRKHRGRRSTTVVIMAVWAMLATVMAMATPAGSQTGDDNDPVAADPGPIDATDPVGDPVPADDGLGADAIAALEADAAAEIGADVVMDGTPIVPQGTNAALDAGDTGPDDNTAGLTPDPDPDLLAGDAPAGPTAPVINAPAPGTSSSISFADAAGGADLLAGDAVFPEAIQEEIDTAVRSRVVSVSTAGLAADLAAQSVTIDLFDDVTLDLETTVAPSPGEMGSVMWGATPAPDSIGSPFGVVTIIDDRMIGGFWVDDARYEIRPLGNGDHLLFEVGRTLDDDPEHFDLPPGPDNGPSPYGPGGELHAGSAPEGGDLAADYIAAPVVDVMVAVDAEALTAYGSQQAAIDDAVANVNLSNVTYLNSGTAPVQNMNLTNVYFTGYTPTTTDGPTYRNQLANKTDGTFDAVHTVRDNNGADLVVLIFNRTMFSGSTSLCGISFFPTSANPAENDAYNITKRSCATPTALTFPHELGHNQCAGHDSTGGGCSTYTVDMGYVDASTGNRTIMARNSNTCCTRRPVWSDPAGNFGGWVTGNASTNNQYVLEQEDRSPGTVSGGVADYRASLPVERSMAGLDGVTCIFNSLEDAVANAAPGSTIYVAPGTYAAQSSSLNYNVSKDLDIVQGTNLCEPTASPTVNGVILQPAAGTTGDAVLEVSGSGTLLRLDHITVEGSTSTSDGGNVQIFSGAELVLDDSIVRNANVGVDGGGVRVLTNGTLTTSGNYQIENNTTSGNGGGVYVDGGTVNLDSLGDIDNNDAVNGGGIYATAGSVVNVTANADVLSNTASNGGGIYADNSTVTITGGGSFVGASGSGNSAGTGGGGVFATNGALVVIENGGAVNGNTAGYAGGVRTTGATTVVRVNDGGAVNSNSATSLGGGAFYSSSSSTIDLNAGSAVSSNTSTTEGGAGRVFGTLDVDGSTAAGSVIVSNNAATTDGGGFWLAGSSHGIDQASFTGNTAVNGGALYVTNATLNITENLACSYNSLGFEEYCNAFDGNSVTGQGAAIYLDGSATLNAVQAGFQGNDAPGGSVIMITDTASASVRSSVFLTNDTGAGGGGDGVITWNGTPTSIQIIGVTFGGNNPQLAMDSDGTPSALEVSRVLTDNGSLGIGTATGSCNLSAVGTTPTIPGLTIANPRFESNGETDYMPAPRGPAADKCALLGGHPQDARDYSVKDADGVSSSTEWDIGAIEADRQPLITPGGFGQAEGNSGLKTFSVPVRLDIPSTETITIDWQTLSPGNPGLATANVDFIAASGTVTFAPGSTLEYVDVSIIGDTDPEPGIYLGEWLPIAFSNPSENAEQDFWSFIFGIGLIIIGNDDGPVP